MPPSSRHLASPAPVAPATGGGTSLPAPLARTPRAAARLQWFLDRAVERLSRQCPEALAVHLVGSWARGEGTVLEHGERTLVLSDLDLAVIVADPAVAQRVAPRLARLSRELGGEFAAFDFLGAVDLGTYAVADLPRQAARPGTLEWQRSGLTVFGDPAWKARLPTQLPSAIPLDEVLALLENRMLELLSHHPDAGQSGRRAWLALYAGGKGVLDAALSHLLVAGQCPAGVEERARAYAPLADGEGPGPSLESVRFWTQFKLAPLAEAVAARYGPNLDVSAWAGGAWEEGGRALLQAYRAVVTAHWPEEKGAWLARAAGRARHRRRARRAFEAWREAEGRRLDWARLDNLPRFVRAGTPEHLLGAHAAALVAEAVGEEGAGLPPPLTAVRDFVSAPGAAPWEVRRRQAVQAWDRWVLRGVRVREEEK